MLTTGVCIYANNSDMYNPSTISDPFLSWQMVLNPVMELKRVDLVPLTCKMNGLLIDMDGSVTIVPNSK